MSQATTEWSVRNVCARWLLATVAVVLLWGLLAWPLPRHARHAIPCSAQNIERPALRNMIPGDHLQLLYHFELFRRMAAGVIPWFSNPYEAHFGEEAPSRIGAYFFPMSGVYALGAGVLGEPLAWNLTGLLAVWLTAVFLWAWLRRLSGDAWSAGLGTLAALVLPYPWAALFGGSPAGFALFWIPALAWCVDRMVREARLYDGLLAGLCLLGALWGDLQVFFFAALSLPVLVLVSLVRAPLDARRLWRRWLALAPGFLLMAGAVFAYRYLRHDMLTESLVSSGRSWREVALYSPHPRGLIARDTQGNEGLIYLGVPLLLSLALAGMRLLPEWIALACRRDRRALLPVILGIACVGVIWFALGSRSPDRGAVLRWARDRLPFLGMLRQPIRAYALVPLLASGLLAVGWGSRGRRGRTETLRRVFMILLALALVIDAQARVRATLSAWNPEQGAYAAIAEDARSRAQEPAQVLVLPLWPGDSADTSLPLIYAQHYDLRLVNKYSPRVDRRYFEDVFRFLQSANQGHLTGDQIEGLRARGIHYLALHENLFPERVSPFPVRASLHQLDLNPHISLLAREGPVWAFRLHDPLPAKPRAGPAPSYFFPSRYFEAQHLSGDGERVRDADCSGGAYRTGARRLTASPFRLAPQPDLAWLLRVRGEGSVRFTTQWQDERLPPQRFEISSPDWTWVRVPLPPLPSYAPVRLHIETDAGTLDWDCGLLWRGAWNPPASPGESMVIPAADFFRAGRSDPKTGAVRFEPEEEADRVVLYGPRLPLDPGWYRIEWVFESPAPDGMLLAEFSTTSGVDREWIPIVAGEPARHVWRQQANVPALWRIRFHRNAPLVVKQAVLSRLPAALPGAPPERPFVAVLAFHRVLPEIREEYIIPPEKLERILFDLNRLGFEPVRMRDLEAALYDGAGLPPRPALLVFDDAYYDHYRYALPVLREYGWPAVFAVPTGLVSGDPAARISWGQGPDPESMTWAELASLAAQGMELVSHGDRHLNLTRLEEEALDRELRASRERLFALDPEGTRILVYPGGRQNARVREHALRAGYRLGFLSGGGPLYLEGEPNPMALPRIHVPGYRAVARDELRRLAGPTP